MVLPEMWNCPYSNASFPVYAEDIEGGRAPSVDMMIEAASTAGRGVGRGGVHRRYRGGG